MRKLLFILFVLCLTISALAVQPGDAHPKKIDSHVYYGSMIIKSLDSKGLIVAIKDPESSDVSDIFVYRSFQPYFTSTNLHIEGRLVTTSNGMVILSRTSKLAYVLSLDADADDAMGFDLDNSGYAVTRIKAGTGLGLKHVPTPGITYDEFDRGEQHAATVATNGRPVSSDRILYQDYDWDVSGSAATCNSGGTASTSCSITCGGGSPISCSVSCSARTYSCCGCGFAGASCGCVPIGQ